MAGNHFTVTFDAQLNVGQVKSAIGEMKKGLEGLKLPDNMDKKVNSIFSSMTEELKKFEALAARDLKTPGDFNKLNQSGEKILHLYQRLRTEVSGLTNLPQKSLEKLFPPSLTSSIDKATAALNKYKEAQKQVTDELSNRRSLLGKKEKELADAESKHKDYMDKDTYKQEVSRLEELVTKRQELERELERRDNGGRQKKGASDYSSFDIKKLREEYKGVGEEVDKLQEKLSKVTTKALESTTSDSKIKTLREEIQSLVTDIDRLQGQDNLNLDNLFSALEGIEGIDLSKVERTAEGAQQAISNLSAEGAQQLLNNLGKIGTTVDAQKGAFEGLENSVHKVGEEVDAADAKFRDVSAIKSRVAAFLSVESAVRLFRRAIRSSFETIKELDKTMTETAVVTDFSVSDMWKQLPKYTKMANELGVTTNDAYKAATLYYQQGLSTNQVMAVSNETLKMARIAGIDAADATDYMTAALRGFNMEINEASAQRVNDVYSKLAAETASDTEELSIAMSKTASIASSANMEFENTAALLAQIIETTREAPETAGTAMKTIIARFSEVKSLFSQGQLMGTDEEGEEININKIDTALKNVGISLKDFLSGEIGLDDVLLQLASKWDTLDLATQRYIATTAAGSRQQSRFLAMMSNYSRTVELTNKAYSAEGAGQEQFEKTLDSMETALARLKNAWDQFAMGIMNSSIAKGGISALTGLLETINKLTSGLGDLGNTIGKLAISIGTFQLGRGLFDILTAHHKGTKVKSISGKHLVNFKNIGTEFKNNLFETVQGELDAPSPKKISFSKAFSGFFKGSIDSNQVRAVINRDRPDIAQFSDRYVDLVEETFHKRGRQGVIELGEEWGVDFNTADGPFGAQALEEAATKAQLLGVAASVAGGAMLKLGNALEAAGHNNAAEVFNTLGTAVMTAGVAISALATILPALGNAFPILGAKIQAAGLTALSGWLWLAAIIAAIGAIAYLSYKLIKGIRANSLEGQISATEKAIQRSREEADKANSAYNELLEAKDSYNELQEGLSKLTTGTQEWTNALIGANEQVLDLINKYPKLSEYLKLGEKGQLEISQEGWQYMEDAAQKGVRNSQAALINNQLKLEKLKGRRANSDLYNSVEDVNHNKLASRISKWKNDSIEELVTGENFAKTFESKDNANLRKLAKKMNISTDQAYDLRDSFAAYNASLVEQEATTKSLAKSLLSISASKDTLNYKFSDQLLSGVADRMISDDYDKVLTSAASEISNISSERFKSLAEDYGVATEMVGNSQKDLETLYAAMKNIDVESVSEAEMSVGELSKEIAAMSQSEDLSKNLDILTDKLKGLDDDTERQLAGLLSGDLMDLTGEEVTNLNISALTDTLKNALGSQADEIMQSLGYESFESFAQGLADNEGLLREAYGKSVSDTIGKINKYAEKPLENIGEKEAQYLLNGFAGAQQQFRDMGLEFQSIANGIFEAFEGSGNFEMVAAGWQSFSEAVNKGATAEEISQMSNWIQSIDWSNPIEGAYALGEAVNSTNQQIQDIAKSMQAVQGDTYDAASQMQYLVKNGDFEAIKEDLKDILNAGEEITGADIRGLTKNYKNLDHILKNTGMSANALGKTLSMLADGSINIDQLTNPVLAAIKSFNAIQGISESTIESISNFEAGIDEGEVTNFIKGANELISEKVSSGQVGNTQIGSYLDYLFGASWDKGITDGAEYAQKIQQLNSILAQNSENMGAMWNQLMAGQNAMGEALAPDKLTDLGFSFSNGKFDIYEGTTTQDILDQIVSRGYTPELAQMMLTDLKNRAPDAMLKLQQADFTEGIRNAGAMSEVAHGAFSLDESEVKAIAQLWGESEEAVKAELKNQGYNMNYTDFFEKDGSLKDSESLFQQMGYAMNYGQTSSDPSKQKSFEEIGKESGRIFKDSFLDSTGDMKIVDTTALNKQLTKFGFSEEQKSKLTADFASSISEGGEVGFKYLSQVTGKEETFTLKPDVEITPENIQIEQQATELQLEAKVYGDAIASSLKDQEVNVTANPQGLASITGDIEAAAKAANAEADVTADTTAAEGKIKSLDNKKVSVTADAKTGVAAAKIKALTTPRSTSINVDVYYNIHFGAKAKGVKNSKKDELALTGEKGPELHQTKNGAYITGANGPAIDAISKGDTIYTAEETKKILKGNNFSGIIPRFAKGLGSAAGRAISGTTKKVAYSANLGGYGGGSSRSGSSRRSGSSGSKSGGSSKGAADNTKKAADDAEKWENSFDHLYNLTQDINAELRVRNRLEREYKKALDQAIPSGKELAAITYSQVWNLEKAKKQQEEMLELREKQMRDYQSENSDLNQYGWFNWKDRTIEINWDLINGVTDQEQGDKIEKYINKLEEIQDQMEEAQDAIDDIYDDLQEIVERGDKANQDLQDRVLDALIDREQKQIDLQEKTNQAINDAANDLHDAISRNIDKMRRDRDNEKTKEDIAEKERRLAYLRMDTTGGNAVEIKQLEKEIKEQRQDFNDTLVDQALSDMQEQNEEAAEQRQRQVELMEGVLDYQKRIGYFADRALDIVEKGVAGGAINENSDLYKLLVEDNDKYWEESVASRQASLNEIARLIAEKYAADKKVEQDRSLYNGGYLERMTKASSAEDFRMAEEARNKYINEHPEEGWHTSGLSDAYGIGQRNDKGYKDKEIYGTYNKETNTWSGGIDWQAKINEALKNNNYEMAAMYEGYRDLKIKYMKQVSPDYVKQKGLKETYGSQSAAAYARDTKGKTFSGSYGESYYHPASHGTYETLVQSKEKYNNEDNTSKYVQVEPDDGGWMALVQKSINEGDFDAAYHYAKQRDTKTAQTGENYDEPNTYKYVYNIEKGYPSALKKAEQYYDNGIKAGYDNTNYMQKIEDEMNKSKPSWKDIFIWAGQRDTKLQNDPDSKKYWNGDPKDTWNKVFPRWPKKFKTGGLVEGTGLAWLDGTPSHPEYVLNAGQTQAFLKLSDMVSNLTSGSSQQLSGDTYIDVDITVDQIASDYDVEAAADKVKQILYQDAMYRNVNRVNFLK